MSSLTAMSGLRDKGSALPFSEPFWYRITNWNSERKRDHLACLLVRFLAVC
jgi:hypothetical protein